MALDAIDLVNVRVAGILDQIKVAEKSLTVARKAWVKGKGTPGAKVLKATVKEKITILQNLKKQLKKTKKMARSAWAGAEVALQVANKAKTDAEAAKQKTLEQVEKAKFAQVQQWMAESKLEDYQN